MSEISRQQALRRIPSVDEVLSRPEVGDLLRTQPRAAVVEAVRRGLEALRRQLLDKEPFDSVPESLFSFSHFFPLFRRELDLLVHPRLCRLINATGIVIHTNLGRAPLHVSAIGHLLEVSKTYSNLEYDLEKGERGSRHAHAEEVLRRLSGAESAIAVNNNAGAVFLVLNTLASGREVIVSRGELVEIGGAFRIPDVMRQSGAVLREVGTTNRTHLRDYETAVGPETALLLKVHPSNFRIMGFRSEVSLDELVGLGKRTGLPVMNDLGSGCLIDLSRYGLKKEPTVQETIRSGVDVVTFSGDKLLGGPQAGVILGKKTVLDAVKVNPLTRALRIDKLTLAALESTLLLYLDEEKAMKEIPVLSMLTLGRTALRRRARRLLKKISEMACRKANLAVREDVSQVGGGSLPDQELPTIVLAVKPLNLSPNGLEERLRRGVPPVICRISKDEVLFDVRTVFEEEIPLLAAAIGSALSEDEEGRSR